MLIRREKFESFCLNSMLTIALVRSTNIGFAYPSSQYQLAQITYFPQKIMQISVLFLLLVYLFFSCRQVLARVRIDRVEWFVIISVFISFLLSDYKWLTLRYLISFSMITLPPILFYYYYGPEKLLTTVTKILSILVVANFIYVLVFPQYAIMTGVHDGAWRGMFVHKNVAGTFFALASIVFLSRWYCSESRRNLNDVLLVVVSIVMVLGSRSITALITLAVVHCTFWCTLFVLKQRDRPKKVRLIISYSAMLSVLVVLLNMYFDDVMTLLGRDPSLTGRTGLWEVLITVVLERPLFGHGVGLFSRPEIMHEYSSLFGWMAKSTHSSYLDLLLGIGFLGTISVLLWLIKSMLDSVLRQLVTAKYAGQLSGAISVMIGCLTVATSASEVLIGTDIHWTLIICMLYFCYSKEVVD